MNQLSWKRRIALTGLAAAMAAALPLGSALAQAPKEVKVAVVVPLSGPWARNGELHVKGAQAAVDDINAAGGIKALGGARMKLLTVDSGDSVENRGPPPNACWPTNPNWWVPPVPS